jgi:hypothetical protein
MTDEMNVDWFRVCIAINGFRARYGSWPTTIHLPKGVLEPLFKPATLARLNDRIKIIYDDSYFVTRDDQGNFYSFKTDGFVDGSDIDARDWLGVSPDINSIEEDTIPNKFYAEIETAVQEQPVPEKKKAKPLRKEKEQREKKVREKKPKEKKVREKKVREKKPKEKSRKRRPIVVIISAEVLLLVIAALYLLVAFAMNFQGQCIKSGTLAACTLFEYLYQVMFLIPGRIVAMASQYWYIALALVILFPLIGLVLNNRKGKKAKVDKVLDSHKKPDANTKAKSIEEQRLDDI